MFDDLSLLFILGKDPHKWSTDDAETICQIFKTACDNERSAVDKGVVTQLWRYWFLVHRDRPLLDNPKYNMALMLGAQAFGEFVPSPDNDSFFGRYRKQNASFEINHAPSPMSWGIRVAMSLTAPPLLDSAVVHVYLFRADQHIEEIMIVGHPPPELHLEIFQSVFSCLLRIRPSNQDAIYTGLYHILSPNSKQEIFELPGIITSTLQSGNSQTVAEVLNDLVQKFRHLQQQTELIAVHECDVENKRKFDSELTEYARQAHQEQTTIIVSKVPEQSPGLKELVTLSPYRIIAKRARGSLSITLPTDIIENSSFDHLLEAFTFHAVERTRIDAQIRKKAYEKQADQLRDEHRRWQESDEGTRRALWSETVILTESFNHKTGTTIRLAQPTEIPRAKWLQETVPFLIQQYEQWARQMQKIVDDVREVTEQPGAPIRHLAANFFLDAALRDRNDWIAEPTLRKHFERWANQIAPYLRCQWYIALENKGLNPRMIFNRHTVFHTHFQVNDFDEVIGLIMQPLSLTSPTHSVYIFDPEKHFVTTHTVSDDVSASTTNVEFNSEQLWQKLIDSITKGAFITQTNLNNLLLSNMLESPSKLLPKLVTYLTEGEKPSQPTFIQNALNSLRNHLHLVNFPSKMITLYSQRAFHSARKLIHETPIPTRFQVHLLLWQVLIECAAEGYNPMTYIPESIQYASASAGTVDQLLRQAMQIDAVFVRDWVKLIENNENLLPAISMLRRNWIRLEEVLDPKLLTLYNVETAVESVSLARSLEKAAEKINNDGESSADILSKIGVPLIELLLTDLGHAPYSNVLELLEILSGDEVLYN